jgi:hypothetical protein
VSTAASDLYLEAAEASTWLATDIQNGGQWEHTLSPEEIAELATATRQALDKGLEVGRFGREYFPLPTLGPRIERIVDHVENGIGFAVVHGVPVDDYNESALKLLYWGLGAYTGQVISQNSKGQLLAEVSDRGNAYGDRNTRGFSTNAELSPHVDTSDMTALLCVRTAKHGGDSRVVSSSAAYNVILAEHPEYLPVLFRGFKNDLRGEGPTGKIYELTHARIPVYNNFAGRTSCSFNYRMIENAAQKLGVPLTGLERAALDFLREVTLRDEMGVRFSMRKGDVQMVSNHSVFPPRTFTQRRYRHRLWVNVRGGRELAPDFADRYNTGPRGGVALGDGARYEF